MTADQLTAFVANGGFTPTACTTLMLSSVFAVLFLWGVWALKAAYIGWADSQLSQRQLLAVLIRFVAVYLALSFFLLS